MKHAPTDPVLLRAWLKDRIAEVGAGTGHQCAAVATGWGGAVGELRRGAVHEWCGLGDADGLASPRGGRVEWVPPLLILAHLVRQSASADGDAPWSVWVGRRVWPTLHNLAGDNGANVAALLARAVLVDPASPAERLWAIDAALRAAPGGEGTGGFVVVADGSALDMAGSRRLQLAAESGGALALVARPPHELSRLSAASTRWEVSRAVSRAGAVAWSVRLVRGKGLPTMVTHEAALLVERTDVGQVVRASSDLGQRSGRAAAAC